MHSKYLCILITEGHSNGRVILRDFCCDAISVIVVAGVTLNLLQLLD